MAWFHTEVMNSTWSININTISYDFTVPFHRFFKMSTEMETMIVMVTVISNETVLDPSDDTLKMATKVSNVIVLTLLMISMGCTIDLKDFKDTVWEIC